MNDTIKNMLRTCIVGTLIISMTIGMVYFIKQEEYNKPMFNIRQDVNSYYSNDYTIDTLGCIHFTCKENSKNYNIVLCGKYLIKEKIKYEDLGK